MIPEHEQKVTIQKPSALNNERILWGSNVAEPRRYPHRWASKLWTASQASLDQARFESDVLLSGDWVLTGCYFEGTVAYDSEYTRFESCYFNNGYPEGPGEPGKMLAALRCVETTETP